MVNASPEYEANRARISVALSQFTVPLLSSIYRAFDGDMVASIVLGEIAHRNVEAWLSDRENDEGLLMNAEHREVVMRPCNALSIAEACKLPRETVRRKVVALIERGYVYRNDEGHLFLTTTVGDDFVDMTADIIEGILVTARRLEALLAGQRVQLGPLRMA